VRRNLPRLPSHTESSEQITLFQWAVYNAKTMPELALLHHVPNGGLRTKATAGRMRSEGVKAGVPDICLPVPRGAYHGLYIELKRVGGAGPTKHQQKWIDALARQGYKASVCFGWESAAREIQAYIKQ